MRVDQKLCARTTSTCNTNTNEQLHHITPESPRCGRISQFNIKATTCGLTYLSKTIGASFTQAATNFAK